MSRCAHGESRDITGRAYSAWHEEDHSDSRREGCSLGKSTCPTQSYPGGTTCSNELRRTKSYEPERDPAASMLSYSPLLSNTL